MAGGTPTIKHNSYIVFLLHDILVYIQVRGEIELSCATIITDNNEVIYVVIVVHALQYILLRARYCTTY